MATFARGEAMTLVVLQYRREHGDIRVMADTRLSSDDGVLTDHMPKLFQLYVRCYGEKEVRPLTSATIGLAFAGSASVAFATVATIQGYLGNLHLPQGGACPTLSEIAQACRAILRENWRDFGNLWPAHAKCEILIFGATPSDRRLTAHYLKTIYDNNQVEVSGYECDNTEHLFAIGSGAKRYLADLKKQTQETGQLQPWNTLLHHVRDDKIADVGGSIQVALATKGEVVLPIVGLPTPERGERVNGGFFLGRMSEDLEKIGQCSIGHFLVA
jgi:hypothetical protein